MYLFQQACQERIEAIVRRWVEDEGESMTLAKMLRDIDSSAFRQMMVLRTAELRAELQKLEADINQHPRGVIGYMGNTVANFAGWKI